MMKTQSPKERNHVLHEALLPEILERQTPSQWGCGEGNERWINCALLFGLVAVVVKFEVLKARKESDEIQDLTAGAIGVTEGKESKSWGEMSEPLSNVRHEVGYLKVIDSELL